MLKLCFHPLKSSKGKQENILGVDLGGVTFPFNIRRQETASKETDLTRLEVET